jgi:hypothetical protein
MQSAYDFYKGEGLTKNRFIIEEKSYYKRKMMVMTNLCNYFKHTYLLPRGRDTNVRVELVPSQVHTQTEFQTLGSKCLVWFGHSDLEQTHLIA